MHFVVDAGDTGRDFAGLCSGNSDSKLAWSSVSPVSTSFQAWEPFTADTSNWPLEEQARQGLADPPLAPPIGLVDESDVSPRSASKLREKKKISCSY